jgi:prolyl-tRNA synthetase
VDHAALALADFVCGANEKDAHLTGVNWGRDLPEPEAADLRNVVAGDPSPTGQGKLAIRRGIEVGHIFQLGRKYSEAMKATVLDGRQADPMLMGCYGIGVTRIVAAAIEQNHDERGHHLARPARALPVRSYRSTREAPKRVRDAAERCTRNSAPPASRCCSTTATRGPGVKFADAELLGIPAPHVIGDRGLDAGQLEYRHRRAGANEEFPRRWPARRPAARILRGLTRAAMRGCSAWLGAGRPGVVPTPSATRNCAPWCRRRSTRPNASPTSSTPPCGTR